MFFFVYYKHWRHPSVYYQHVIAHKLPGRDTETRNRKRLAELETILMACIINLISSSSQNHLSWYSPRYGRTASIKYNDYSRHIFRGQLLPGIELLWKVQDWSSAPRPPCVPTSNLFYGCWNKAWQPVKLYIHNVTWHKLVAVVAADQHGRRRREFIKTRHSVTVLAVYAHWQRSIAELSLVLNSVSRTADLIV